MERRLNVELLWWDGCPSTPAAVELMQSTLAELGLHQDVRMVEVESDDRARQLRFPGSPTIRIDGEDLDVLLGRAADAEPVSLTCRVYRRRDGRISPTPDPADVREALERALARREPPREAA